MTHTLHRVKKEGKKQDDYVILIMPARGINNKDVVDTFRKYYDLLHEFNPINMGGISTGNLVSYSFEELKSNLIEDAPMMHAVFADRETLIRAMRALKDADYGYSAVVSGLLEDVKCCAKEAGVHRHSVNISLGIWGKTELLPPDGILEITTMCGHAMISVNLVNKLVDDIKAGRSTSENAAKELSKLCVCGIFNTQKSEKLLLELTGF